MAIPLPATLDYETKAIQSRPAYPPEPGGVSVLPPRAKKSTYDGWGHPEGNNSTKAAAKKKMQEYWNDSSVPLLFHNAKFDYDVATTRHGLKKLPWERIHDTLYLLFLHDPHARSLSLKPSAERLLGMPPEEQDAVKAWLMEHHATAKKAGKEWGAYIMEAPGTVVGPYADGDVIRTRGLFNYLYQDIVARGMLTAYNRERQLMPILLENEQQGIRVDLAGLERDYQLYLKAVGKADAWLRKRLKLPKDFNIDSDDQFGQALDREGIVTDWVLTKTGKKSVSKKNLTLDMFNDKRVASAYGYRNRAATCIRMFMEPWLLMARESNGFIYTTWNQVRQAHGDDGKQGTRSGRLSSTPNFQNISKDFEAKGDGYTHPKFLNVPPLPLMRKYMLPDEGGTWLHRDYSQQELRILAHFEDGPLLQAYLANPDLDVHGLVGEAADSLGIVLASRTLVKNAVFQKVYGGGIPAICAALHCDPDTAKKFQKATSQALPGYEELNKAVKYRGKMGEPIITWGGREYHPEPPGWSDKFGRHMTFEYKLLNYLIQGSAADCTKQALIDYHNHPKRQARLLCTVHDEINVSAPKGREKEEMAILKECMMNVAHEGNRFDLPMMSGGKVGPTWGDCKKVDW